jgi:hypothetical protein
VLMPRDSSSFSHQAYLSGCSISAIHMDEFYAYNQGEK